MNIFRTVITCLAALGLLWGRSVYAQDASPQLPWPDLSSEVKAIGGGENDAALIVAIEEYDHVLGVPGAKETADDWYSFLVDGLKIPLANVKLMPQRNATREEILIELEKKVAAAGPGGKLWFVFIGHGAPSKQNGVLLGVDVRANPISIEARSIKLQELLASANSGQAQPVFVLDACFSGASRDGSAVVEGLMPLENAPLPEPGKAIVVTASASDEYAGALPGAKKPAFSYLTLGALQGWGDRDLDGTVTAEEMLYYSKSTLAALLTGRTQTPELVGSAGNTALVISTAQNGPDIKEFAMQLAGPPEPEPKPEPEVQEDPETSTAALPPEKQQPEPEVSENTSAAVVMPQETNTNDNVATPQPKKKKAGIVIIGIGAVMGVTGAIIGGISMSKENQLEEDCTDYHCETTMQNDINSIKKMNTVADVLYITAGVTALTGIIVTAVQAKQRKRELALTPTVTPHGAGISLRRTF